MKGLLTIWAPLALALSPSMVAAQEAEAVAQSTAAMEQAMGAFAEAFVVEPLTPEQAARLPLARSVVDQIMPPGSLGELMGSMLDDIITPLGEVSRPRAVDVVAQQLGLRAAELTLTDEQVAVAIAMFDPAFEERHERTVQAMPQFMTGLMNAMEPAMRGAMVEIYAVHFNQSELTDIAAFFATTSGASYARQSFAIASDRRLMAAVLAEMPNLTGEMMTMAGQMEAAVADLPPARGFAELASHERKRLADMLGMTVEDLDYMSQYGVGSEAAAAAAVAADAAFEGAYAAGKAY
jgi:Uncharacterized protein conserved in bacteria (DUF2059)